MKYTTTSLIEILKKFPENTPIDTELAFMWEFPEELNEIRNGYSEEYFRELTMQKVTRLCIFEGSWEKGNVSDVENRRR